MDCAGGGGLLEGKGGQSGVILRLLQAGRLALIALASCDLHGEF